MIVLNECRITEDGKTLIIEASVDSLNYFNDVYIKGVYIDTDETLSPSNTPSSNCVYIQEFEPQNTAVSTENGKVVTKNGDCTCTNVTAGREGKKNIRLYLSAKDLNMSSLDKNIFFVYVVATGYPDPSTPCTMDTSTVVGIALNLRPLYNEAMGYIKELNSSCSTPKGFIDMILRLKAFELALKTGNYTTAIKYWGRLFKNKISVPSKKNCGCNGIN